MIERLRLRDRSLDWRRIEGEVIALDVTESLYLRVNASGAVLWSALGDGASREQLGELLVEEFAVSPAQAREDVDAFVKMLDDHGLLEREPA